MIDAKVTAIFFDADSTLYSLRRSIGTVYSECAGTIGLKIDPLVLDQRTAELWPRFEEEYLNHEEDHATSPGRERELWKRFCTYLLADLVPTDLFDEYFEGIYQAFAVADSRVLSSGLVPLLESLRQRNIVTGILSNNDSRVMRIIAEFQIDHLFDHVFPAEVIGYKKPSPHCFEWIRTKLALRPENLLYIGDDLRLDYEAAQKAGWHALLYDPEQRSPRSEIRRIGSFHDLL